MALTALLLTLRYHRILTALDMPFVLEQYRDGIKTYEDIIYHAKYDRNASEFCGVNYPYKEHVMAAMELPGLAILIHWLTPVFPELPKYTYGILHLLLILSIWLCAILLFLIFNELSLPPWYGMLVAIGITFLAPQNLRFIVHFGLAPPFVVPAIIYGLILLGKKARYTASIYLAVAVFFSSMLHFYFFGITCFTIGLYFLFSIYRNFNKEWLLKNLPHYALALGLPLIFFTFWMVFNDPVTDRTNKPLGFLIYHSNWEGLFLFPELHLWHWIDKNIIKIGKTEFEGWSYIGLVAGLFIVFSLGRWAIAKFKKPLLLHIGNDNSNVIYPLLGTGIVAAIFACSQPFNIKGLGFLVDYIGPLKQFRSTGRFAWVFYFIINIIAFTSIYNWISKWEKLPLKCMAFILVIGVLFYEAYTFSYSKFMFNRMLGVEELSHTKKFTDVPNIDYNRYQAVIPVPYFNIGDNNFSAVGDNQIIQMAKVLSAQTGLPLTAATLTRSSRMQTFKQMQLVDIPMQIPVILSEYPNDKPLLLLVSSELSQKDSLKYFHLFKDQPLIYENDRYSLYELSLESIALHLSNRKQGILNKTMQYSYRHGAFMSADSVENFVYVSFDSLASGKVFKGGGAFEAPQQTDNVFFEGNIPNVALFQDYELLLWVYVNEDYFSVSNIKVEEYDAYGKKVQEQIAFVSTYAEEFDAKGWVLVQLPFEPQKLGSKYRASISLLSPNSKHIVVDEMLIKPASADIYKIDNDTLWWNNRIFE
ncbi:MAG: hypothetical protein GC192_18590 [Bacteroidetes bacterium]|nr:hypothetical protein [Bacteroidota bacterium]